MDTLETAENVLIKDVHLFQARGVLMKEFHTIMSSIGTNNMHVYIIKIM